MELVSYLKSLDVKDGAVLLHGWFPHLYWLSGLEAPSKYVCTVREWAPIPPEEYEALLTKVGNLYFEYVILPRFMLDAPDPIAENTIAKYSYVKSIGDALVYSKYFS
jgi:hypothetical protein